MFAKLQVILLTNLFSILLKVNALPVSSGASSATLSSYLLSFSQRYSGTTTASVSFENPFSEGYLGATTTGAPPFLAETDDVAAVSGIPTKSYIRPQPIETSDQSLDYEKNDTNIFELMGSYSPYFISDGWGIYEYSLPDQCTIKQVQSLTRHGSRYPTSKFSFDSTLQKANFTASGNLSFLNTWTDKMGGQILTSLGNQQLFDKGVATWFNYGSLANIDSGKKYVARSTSEERMKYSAIYFLTGFYGLDWENYANLELLIEEDGFNNTLAPYDSCPNYIKNEDSINSSLAESWLKTYLTNATNRINSQLTGVKLNYTQVFDMQSACAYETNALGYSKFCSLFTQEEWEGYEYYIDVDWYETNSFGTNYSKALGIGWVEEFYNRLTQQSYNPAYQAEQNTTFDKNVGYFPTDQNLYFDFTHDSVIINIFTALGLNQFKSNFTGKGPDVDGEQPFRISKLVPFASQTYFEVIECESEVPADRSKAYANGTSTTSYIHMVVNENTIPLNKSIPTCGDRVDGWCEFDTFIDHLETLWNDDEFDAICYGSTSSLTNSTSSSNSTSA
ncbi:hypothetical protein PACTADRAFT_84670 [Pachysolen tannophilus NRRL Y-2460]|uniref:Acid phosphatase n=1 Tax=Pachysolen tannophilus NRRL Y-2460 TaxID=669874 RepID=A0A1E4TVM4_PACTA|nr:hypothetical protein PACTADRAFT_84670 [Pachysolen tannophilus NRRL Y-2460]